MAEELATELAYYEEHREEFLQHHPGRYLLIRGASLIGGFDTWEGAIEEGVRRFCAGPFLVRCAGEDAPALSAPALTTGVPLVANP